MTSTAQSALLEKYVKAVLSAPSSLGLTATRQPEEFWERHVLDALKLLSLLPQRLHTSALKVIDIGSGNGIPGIPIAIAAPSWQVYLLDAINKKAGFLDMFCKYNKIDNLHVLAGRAEEFGHQESHRAQYDLAFARALGKLPVALELTIPFIKRDGLLIVPHGTSHKGEIEKSKKALSELGAVHKESIPYQLTKAVSFTALVFQKIHDTPDRYPRKSGMPTKRPL